MFIKSTKARDWSFDVLEWTTALSSVQWVWSFKSTDPEQPIMCTHTARQRIIKKCHDACAHRPALTYTGHPIYNTTKGSPNKVVLEPLVSPEHTSKYKDTVTAFAKTWTKGHWPLDDLWPHICWGLMCDSSQGSLYPSPMKIHQSMWIQWTFLLKLEPKVIDP